MLHIIGFIVALLIAFIFGFILCAILTSGKTEDLEREVYSLRQENKKIMLKYEEIV